jgi:hypothetical protein
VEQVAEGAPSGFGDGEGELLVGNTHRIYGLLGKMTKEVIAVLRNPTWNEVASYFLSGEASDYIGSEEISLKSSYVMSLAQSFTVLPGAPDQKLHRDHSEFFNIISTRSYVLIHCSYSWIRT